MTDEVPSACEAIMKTRVRASFQSTKNWLYNHNNELVISMASHKTAETPVW